MKAKHTSSIAGPQTSNFGAGKSFFPAFDVKSRMPAHTATPKAQPESNKQQGKK